MVGPVSNDEREAFLRRLKVGFVVLVAVSAGGVTVGSGTTAPGLVLLAVFAGGLAGVGLAWVVFPDVEYRDMRD